MNYSPRKIQKLLDDYGFNFKKSFGQNFIIDENTIDGIINRSKIDKSITVLEVGPGAGSLTYKLCKVAKNVICYEIDDKLKDILNEVLKEYENIEIIYDDFLQRSILPDLKNYQDNIYLVANLPYYITTPIITKVIEENLPIKKMVVMVQKEVGDRFKASPGCRDYNSLSVYLNYYYDVKKIMDISRNIFMPKPNVDSIIVEFTKKDNLLYLKDKNLFFKLVRDSFKQKRKTIRNNLKAYDLEIIERVLKQHGFDLSVRAEQLSVDVFSDIANELVV